MKGIRGDQANMALKKERKKQYKTLEIIEISRVYFGTPQESRTPDSAVRGQRLDHLTSGACQTNIIIAGFEKYVHVF